MSEENKPLAIAATRRRVKELVDGTLRVEIDIDPNCRTDFLRLFPHIDMPIALAPLVLNFKATAENTGNTEEKELKLSNLAAIWCKSEDFQNWLRNSYPFDYFKIKERYAPPEIEPFNLARALVCNLCGIKSRSELDTNEQAAALFEEKIGIPYRQLLEDKNNVFK